MRTLTVLILSVTLPITGCDRGSSPAMTGPDAPLLAISDGANNGNAHFYFLPPIVKAPAYSGDFDLSPSPVVEICLWQNESCALEVAEFTTASGSGGEQVRIDPEAETYQVNWHTDQFDLTIGATYRVTVLVGSQELGFADVTPVETGRDLKNLHTGDVIGLIDGRTLPIKFRIEQGAVTEACVRLAPVGWWPGEGDGVDVANGNNGALTGGVQFAPGIVGQAFDLNGTDAFVEIPNTALLDINRKMTVAAWVKARTFGFYPSIVGKGNVGSYDESFALYVTPTGHPEILVNSTGGPAGRTILGGSLPAMTPDTWYFIAVRHAPDEYYDLVMYVFGPEGQWPESFSAHEGGIASTPYPVLIGKADRSGSPYETSYFDGLIDEPMIFAQALTADEVRSIFEAGPNGLCR